MVQVISQATLVSMEPGWWPTGSYGSLRLYDQYNYDYATLYRVQPNVRVCVDFLARNIAQLGLHVFRRVSDTDRQRLRDHPLAQLLGRPLPNVYKVTRYRLIESLMADLGIYFNAYWLKVTTEGRMGLLRIPPVYMTVRGKLVPTSYEINLGTAAPIKKKPEEIVHFRGHNADNAIFGLSPLETLRRVLAEEHAMGNYREHFWQNAARMSGIIERPAEAPSWSDPARERFKAEFEALYSGGENSGKTAILEEGMTWEKASFNAQEAEYLGGRKLNGAECARSYHIPLPMVGILDHATFSNIKDQHKQLYQDCMGPWLKMLEEDMELQLLPDFEDRDGVYLEFNIQEKLAGSFEEQAKSYQSAVGRPWMTANEARGRQNLPSLDGDADQLVTPLNVLTGGQASPIDSAPKAHGDVGEQCIAPLPEGGTKAKRGMIDPTLPDLRKRHEAKWLAVMQRHFRRQESAVVGHIPAKTAKDVVVLDAIWDARRWNEELQADLFRMNVATATVWGRYVAGEMEQEFDGDPMLEWLQENARIGAEEINATTRDNIADALTQEEPRSAVQHLFEVAIAARAVQIARSKVTMASVFGSQEGARQSGLRTKTWQVNSANSRHTDLDGETVAMGELFSNGMKWPGDPAGGAENTANCLCSLGLGR